MNMTSIKASQKKNIKEGNKSRQVAKSDWANVGKFKIWQEK